MNKIFSFSRFREFLRHVRIGWLLFTSLLIVGIFFGFFELIQVLFLQHATALELRWLYFTRSVLLSVVLVVWAAWTIYYYRGIYRERLHALEERYEDIIEHSADAIITIDQDDIIRTWNQGAQMIFGWGKNEMIGQNQARIIPRELLDKDELLCIADGIRQNGYVRNYETDRLHKEGKKILVQLTESPIKDDKGEVIGRSQIMRDITNDRMRDQQLQHSERLAAVGHMAAGIAHEVGNPLTSISSLVQLMQRRTSDVFLTENLAKIREHIYRITKIVRDLVDFSRPTLINRSSTDVNELVTSAVGLLKHDSRTRNIDFVIDTQPGLPATMGVPNQLHQVLVNLLLNAVDAVAEYDDKHIAIVTESIDGFVQIRVIDNGCGIPSEIKNRIFEPFFTTKDVGKGTGLGLSVSHGIIKRMGGDISVDSKINKGTTFTIRLPVKEKTLQHVGNDLNS